MAVLGRRRYFSGYFGEKAPIYWLFERGAPSYWVNWEDDGEGFFYLCPKLCWRLAGVSFYGPCATQRAGHLDQVVSLVLPK